MNIIIILPDKLKRLYSKIFLTRDNCYEFGKQNKKVALSTVLIWYEFKADKKMHSPFEIVLKSKALLFLAISKCPSTRNNNR